MRTYLVTGGAGFIGSNYIHYMFRKYDNEIRIINVDALTYAGNLENLKDIENRDNYTFVKANICDKEAIAKIFAENDIDRVVHFAAESHVDRSIRNPEVFVQTNVLGTAVMLNCAKNAWELPDGTFKPGKKFLHVSTDEVYGSLSEDGGYFYETTPYAPHSPYSASKAGSDMLVKAYMDTYHFPANITNCSNNYGPYQFPEKLIPLIINNALHGKKLPVYGDGKNVRDWLYVEDHAKAIDMVQEQGRLFQTYNIGGHNEKQNIEIIHIILLCIERKVTLRSVSDGYVFEDNIDSKTLAFTFGLVSEIERKLVSIRTKEALALIRSKGLVLGRPKGSQQMGRLEPYKEQIEKDLKDPSLTYAQIAEKYNVSLSSFKRFLKEYLPDKKKKKTKK